MITKALPIVFHIEPRMEYTFEHIIQSLQRMSFCACGHLKAFPYTIKDMKPRVIT